MTPREIVQKLHGAVEWFADDQGYISCPAEHLHTSPTGKRDCRVYLSGAPSIYCLHQACLSTIEAANYTLRRSIWDATPKEAKPVELSAEHKARMKARQASLDYERDMRKWANNFKSVIFDKYAWAPCDAWEASPICLLDHPYRDYRKMLKIFHPNDIVWIGEPTDSGDHAKDHFQTASYWLSHWSAEAPPGHFTCPSVFQPGVFNRTNQNVAKRPFLVIESDILSQEQTLAIANWMRSFMALRLMLFTGGKSVHCWFNFPSPDLLEKLKLVLPQLGCDPALFKASQPVRIAGVYRQEKESWQSLLWMQDLSQLEK